MMKFSHILFLILCLFNGLNGNAFHGGDQEEEVIRSRVLNMYHIVDVRYTEDVAFYIDLYTNRHRSLMSDILGRSELFFPVIDQYSAKYGLPYELRYLPIIESALKPYAVSRSKAVGLWQIMHRLGSYYQLRIDETVDERRDLFKSSETAMLYLKDLHEQFDDWTLALAAYNCGPGRMRKAIRESGSRNFWELKKYLPKETQRYIPKFIAFNYLMHYYHQHEIKSKPVFETENSTIEYTIVYDELNFDQIIELTGLNREMVELLNSSYMKSFIPSNSEGYLLSLPSKAMDKFLANYYQDGLDTVFQGIYPRYGIIPRYKVQQSGYTVRSGDNLYNLARRFDCRISDLKNWNYLKNDRIYPGQRLSVVCKAIDPVPINRPRNELKDVPTVHSSELGVEKSEVISMAQDVDFSDHFRPKSPLKYFVVEELISLQEIAMQYDNIEVKDIIDLNELTPKSKLYPGMRLKIGKPN